MWVILARRVFGRSSGLLAVRRDFDAHDDVGGKGWLGSQITCGSQARDVDYARRPVRDMNRPMMVKLDYAHHTGTEPEYHLACRLPDDSPQFQAFFAAPWPGYNTLQLPARTLLRRRHSHRCLQSGIGHTTNVFPPTRPEVRHAARI